MTNKTYLDYHNEVSRNIYRYSNGKITTSQNPAINVLAKATGDSLYGSDKARDTLIFQVFPQTATDEFFILANAFKYTNGNVSRKDPTYASGNISVVTDAIIDIPSGTEFAGANGQLYQSLVTTTTTDIQSIVTSLTRQDNYVTAVLTGHGLGNGQQITISGANESDYNDTYTIELLSADFFGFDSIGSDGTATGTIKASYMGAKIAVQSVEASADANRLYTDSISISSSLNNVIGAFLTYDGITGGTDIETASSVQQRTLEYIRSAQSRGSIGYYTSWMKQNTTANYVYVYSEESIDNIYLRFIVAVLDETTLNFTDFSPSELSSFETLLIDGNEVILGIDDVTFEAPLYSAINITISGLSPNTLSMQEQIKTVLKEHINPLGIKKYLSGTLSELSEPTIQSKILEARNADGDNPMCTSILVVGASNLTTNKHKPILGTVTFN